ncbi:hypothetical protein MICAE_1460032 [Microcystis aeruginosa PCC 9806]|uniref:Uncharacterized protein n=1 Tax=Microcystis aeruginosa PCC 9806 TaxID=1160282 RepID=I4GS81_MICAE|nr:hypothetical protein MICAE_1460032 [Microcystis aeruginosa PCC 9806]
MAFSSPLVIALLPVDKPDFFLKPLYQLSVISYQLSDLSFKCAVCIKWAVLNKADSALVSYQLSVISFEF